MVGSISRLVFAVVGDTRPANEDDPSGYPTSIITKIFQDIEAQSPHPPFTIGTGDYQFSSTGSSSTASQQVGIYMQTRQNYTGAFFPAMGNHECGVSGGFSTSDNNNCGPGNQGGATPNYNAFMSLMLGPISKSTPYYSFNVNATDNSWTAKFVVTAANSWDTAQQTWLTTTMAQPTTYTFVIRHEASDAIRPSHRASRESTPSSDRTPTRCSSSGTPTPTIGIIRPRTWSPSATAARRSPARTTVTGSSASVVTARS